jgi:D-beta-D-heptose 7-phosphate kinase/D-beta-D-heptose 1-phosphate adenosyltransferase
MAARQLAKILDKFSGKKILVIGDSMLDKYIWGEVSRISPEAPVQVVEVQRESYAAGGAANVAMNAAVLGGQVSLVSITGNDESRNMLISMLKVKGINTDGMFVESDKPTTLKMRVMGRSQQLLRVDYEKRAHAHPDIERALLALLTKTTDSCDAIIVSDYAKGVITKHIMDFLISSAHRGKIVVVDPKPQHKELYKGATVITPNHAEACQLAHVEVENGENIENIGKQLVKEMDANIILTRGERGISVFEKGMQAISIPAQAKEVYDVTGAGDTVVATVALALASGAELKEAALLANHAAGVKVGKIGTSAVSREELRKSLEQ